MKRSCPTIGELLAFDAVAHYESVTKAATALCMSVSGVSKQLAGLEAFIGKSLVERSGRGIQLTPKGREYWSKISPCLEKIRAATAEARDEGPSDDVLVLATVPGFLAKWLIPRLPDFKLRHPAAHFVFRQHINLKDPFPPDVDAVIAHGLTSWPRTKRDYLVGREFVCFYPPKLTEGKRVIKTPGDLLNYPLLHLENATLEWHQWATHHGLDDERTLAGPRFAQYGAIIQAVLSGFGVGLAPKILVAEEIEQGKLIEFGSLIEENQGHYFYYRADRVQRPIAKAFRMWLIEQRRGRSTD